VSIAQVLQQKQVIKKHRLAKYNKTINYTNHDGHFGPIVSVPKWPESVQWPP